ncbi:MAG: hypothetical protein KDA42_01265 [Planctomycetales bacterium]|nr:hypothetical protein [Planctomycetales bacterium]
MSVRSAKQRQIRGFNFTAQMRNLCADMVARLPDLAHIDLDRVAITFTQARNRHGHGIQATTTPMRFEHGSLTTRRRGREYTVQRLYDENGVEILYIISFYLPRFQNHSLQEKVATIVHELWHISPHFDGDLRRFHGRCYAHGGRQSSYDRQVDAIADRWWKLTPSPALYEFLRFSFRELEQKFGGVYGTKIPHPKLLPVT